jgi:hypothetical protein
MYYEDPQLTFDDSILYGCYIDMNYEELQNFCNDKEYEKLMIF